jgi:A/G-specific adenine glycosylase
MPATRDRDPALRLDGGVDSRSLVRWWRSHGRDFPWRRTRDPFPVLVAEFMLRRTRASQVAPVYEKFFRRYSTPEDALAESPTSLQSVFTPLGLQWRIDQFRTLCDELVERHLGQVPEDRAQLLSLTGVGAYTAGAVRVFAFGYADALIDVNVIRVLSRYFGVGLGDSARRSTALLEEVRQLVPTRRPREFWWAMLDTAAVHCNYLRPQHEGCPLSASCAAVR